MISSHIIPPIAIYIYIYIYLIGPFCKYLTWEGGGSGGTTKRTKRHRKETLESKK